MPEGASRLKSSVHGTMLCLCRIESAAHRTTSFLAQAATVVMVVLTFVEGEAGKNFVSLLGPSPTLSRRERVDSTILALRNDLYRIHHERGAVRLPLPSLLAALDGRQLRLELFDLAQLRLNFVGVYTRRFRRRLF